MSDAEHTHTQCVLDMQDDLKTFFEPWELISMVLGAASYDAGHPGKLTVTEEATSLPPAARMPEPAIVGNYLSIRI